MMLRLPYSKKLTAIMLGFGIFFAMIVIACSSEKSSKSETAKTDDGYSYTETDLKEESNPDVPVIVFLGDSLTEGYRVAVEENYPSLTQKKLEEMGVKVKVVNGGLSGETSAGGLERLKWFVNLKPQYLFLALGSNDGLRGLNLDETYRNLSAIIEDCQARGVKVLLSGFKIPPNYGLDYTKKFEQIFPHLAKTYDIPLLPFLLDGVAGETELNLADGIHPNPEGYKIISDQVAKFIQANL